MSLLVRASGTELATTDPYAPVDAIFQQHCLDCHADKDPEGSLVLERFDTLMRGGELGPALVPGKSDASLLVQMVEGKFEKDGKKKVMPPGKRKKLAPAEIAILRGWIDAGAHGPPAGPVAVKELLVPKIMPRVTPRLPVLALAYDPGSRWLAAGTFGEVELRSLPANTAVRWLTGAHGNVNALRFSPDGTSLFAAAGQPGLSGEVRQWHVADGKLARTFTGHKDALYALALSPDGQILATGSYDQKIKLWEIETGRELRTLSGHNGAIYGLAFRPDGKILASASADRTVKLWEVASGERRDTLSQSLKELYAVAFSPDGKHLVAGGVDHRIRVWEISESAAETTNPLLEAKYAHEGAILNLVFSADGKRLLSSAEDKTVKVWDAPRMNEHLLLETQSDWAQALAFVNCEQTIAVGRMDGTLAFYDALAGKPLPALSVKLGQPATPPVIPKPDLVRLEPRGIQRGTTAELKLTGANLTGTLELNLHDPNLTGQLVRINQRTTNVVWAKITAAADLARGPYEISVKNTNGESSRIKLYVDDLPQVYESATNRTPTLKLPVSYWGTLEPSGDIDELEFEAAAGQTLVFDLNARGIGSKVNPVLSLFDANGTLLTSNNGFDGGDPLLVFNSPVSGRYRIRINDAMAAGSPDHFYRLSLGAFAEVVACYPLSVPTNSQAEVELIGFNLPPGAKTHFKAAMSGEVEIPVDLEKFRTRRVLKVLAGTGPELIETEPNDTPAQAMTIPAPGAVNGRIWKREGGMDADLFRFETTKGRHWVIETEATRRGSPVDTKVEILQLNGTPVQRLVLQAVRNSAINFRSLDANSTGARLDNWMEMELNNYYYMQGEVARVFRMPQGPDSEVGFFTSNGKRRAFFDTSPTAHALDEPGYIVEPHDPGEKLEANGLPVFPIHFANDDDGERKLGVDSRVHFTAPADGFYLVRVTDTRGRSGERFVYRLVVREARPDFKVKLNGADPTVNAASGREFSVGVERIDGFEGEIRVNLTNVPPGFTVTTPLVVQEDQVEAKGTLHALPGAIQPNETNASAIQVTATALVDGKEVIKKVNEFGKLKLAEPPKLFVFLEPAAGPVLTDTNSPMPPKALELTVAPGRTVPAWLKVQRNGHEDLVTFSVENLPFGVIVDNIGLNGVLIPKGENERQIFLAAEKWVPETDRLCYAVANQAGRQTSLPLLLHVRRAVKREPTRISAAP